MSISLDQSQAKRLRNELLSLQKQDASEARKIATNTQRANQAIASAQRATSASSATSKFREAERYSKESERAQKKRADIAAKISRKSEELGRVEERIGKKTEAENKRRLADQDKVRKAQENRLKELERQAKQGMPTAEISSDPITLEHSIETDVFISHASEDKDDFVKPLAEAAREAGISVWYDEFSLRWGDSLRRKIDEGLSKSHFGIVVLSEKFFAKEWPQYELDALVEKEIAGEGSILPIWHKISKSEVRKFSPSLANRLALSTANYEIDEIVEELRQMVDQLKSA